MRIVKAEIQKNPMLIPPSRLVGIKYYSESHETFAPWFFQNDYSRLVFRGLGVLVKICVAGVFALLFVPLNTIDRIPQEVVTHFDTFFTVQVNEERFYAWFGCFLGLLIAFILLSRLFLLSIRSAGQPMTQIRGANLEWFCWFSSISLMLLIALRIWHESDTQLFHRLLTLYER